MKDSYPYIIVGAGLSGASAVEGIRKLNKTAEKRKWQTWQTA
jgi:UDP-galactopyranose mutase